MTLLPRRFETGRPMLLGGLRQRHGFDDAATGIQAQWRAFLEMEQDIPGRIGTHRYGVLCGADATGMEYMCGVEVEALDALPEGVGRMRILQQEYAVFVHTGTGATLRESWMRAFRWLEDGDRVSAHKPDFEVYGPDYDPEVAGEVELWIAVVEVPGG